MEDEVSLEMGIVGKIDLSARGEPVVDLTGKVHLLPCCIQYNGPSDVSDYFKPKPTGIEVDGLAVEEAYFRGRKLEGTTIPLPHGYSGYVLGKTKADKERAVATSEENTNVWMASARFQNISLWNHESLPSQDDTFSRSLHWLAVAKTLHQPVTAEDMESSTFSQK